MTTTDVNSDDDKLIMPKGGVLPLTIKDKEALYSAYMPYVIGGGMFIPTVKRYALGDEVFLLLRMMDNSDKLPVPGRVIWITPEGSQGGGVAGIGVQFDKKEGLLVQNKIETLLAGALNSDRPHHAM